MARLLQSGAELQSVTAGVEADAIVAGVTISTTASKVRSGLASWKFAPSGTSLSISYTFSSAGTNGAIYSRVYVLFDTLPVQGGNRFSFLQLAGTGGGVRIQATITNTGILALTTASGVVVGQTSAGAIVTGHWYRVELNGNAGASSAELRYVDCGTSGVDPGGSGISVAISSSSLGGSVAKLVVALPTATTTQGVMYADDIAVNDATGSIQTTWCASGRIIHLQPNSAGDANTFLVNVGGTTGTSNNFTRVNETTPDDATSYNASAVLNAEDLFNCADTGSLVGSSDTINTVCIGIRLADLLATDATAAIKAEIMKTTSSTKGQSAAIIVNSTSFVSNSATGASLFPLVTYVDPTGSAWAKSTLDSMQIGYLESAAGTHSVAITTVWASIDFTPELISFISRLGLMGVG